MVNDIAQAQQFQQQYVSHVSIATHLCCVIVARISASCCSKTAWVAIWLISSFRSYMDPGACEGTWGGGPEGSACCIHDGILPLPLPSMETVESVEKSLAEHAILSSGGKLWNGSTLMLLLASPHCCLPLQHVRAKQSCQNSHRQAQACP